jgi:hypothetical protein
VRLRPAELYPEALLLRQPWMSPREYFLCENRQQIGFDRGLTRRQKNFDLPSPAGLIIWHVDENRFSQIDPAHKLLDVEEASPYLGAAEPFEQLDAPRDLSRYQFLNAGNRGDDGDPFPGYSSINNDLTGFTGPRNRNHFDDHTVPSAQTYDVKPSNIAIYNIRLDGAEVLMSISLTGPKTRVASSSPLPPEKFTLVASPNPFWENVRIVGHFSPHQPVEIRIFDLLGRIVWYQKGMVGVSGEFSFQWDGRDDSGRKLANGIYFVRAMAQERSVQLRVILLQ